MMKKLILNLLKLNKNVIKLPNNIQIVSPSLKRLQIKKTWNLKLKINTKFNFYITKLSKKSKIKSSIIYQNSYNYWNLFLNNACNYKKQKLKIKPLNGRIPRKKKSNKRKKFLMLKYALSKANTHKLHQLINTKSQYSLININTAKIPNRDEFRIMLRDCLFFFPFIQLNRVAARLIGAIFELLYLKNTQGLSKFIQKTLQAVHYKKHNTYFSYIGQLVKEILLPQISRFNCLGVCIIFRGKLGIGGNARKRSLKYRTGMSSGSSKFLKINRTFAVIRTKTGTVGFSVLVAW